MFYNYLCFEEEFFIIRFEPFPTNFNSSKMFKVRMTRPFSNSFNYLVAFKVSMTIFLVSLNYLDSSLNYFMQN